MGDDIKNTTQITTCHYNHRLCLNMPPTIVPPNPTDDMILSIDLNRRRFKEYLNGTRVWTVLKWHHEEGNNRQKWTVDETEELEDLVMNQFEKNRCRKLRLNISRFRRVNHVEYCDVEIHDRTLCVVGLLFYEVTDIHRTLDWPNTMDEFTGSDGDYHSLSFMFLQYATPHISHVVKSSNRATVDLIKIEGGAENGELERYKARLRERIHDIRFRLFQVLRMYWMQYETPRSIAQVMNDDFQFQYKDIFGIIELVEVLRDENEDM